MAPPFTRLSLDDFAALLREFPWKRRVTAVHVHHTWHPRRQDYAGEKTIIGMYEFHTKKNGWSDIAQHVSIAPDGLIWTGRNWNQAPASAKGYNGDSKSGPFMFEMIGNFDIGQDPFDGPQKETAVSVVALLLNQFDLALEAVRFHNEMSLKSCPGTAIDRHEFLMTARDLRARMKVDAPKDSAGARAASPFPAEQHSITRAMAALSASPPDQDDPEDAELVESEGQYAGYRGPETLPAPNAEARPPGLSAERLASLRPYVINSNGGVFSDSGLFQTSSGDVDAIFQTHLPNALKDNQGRQPLRILFYAHGGLVGEEAGLQIAADQVDWWRANGIYPIEFVWETGLQETISQLVSPARDMTLAGRRDIFDYTTDRALEELAHRLGGPKIWSGMKYSAMRGIQVGGATHYVVQQLKAFCAKNQNENIELHAVGHSAGSIFHSYFVPEAVAAAGRNFTSMHLLAPAIAVDEFRKRLASMLGNKIQNTTIFTMAKDWERADSCASVYRKSLLYLIYYALEQARETPILGLEVSLRDDPSLRAAFGLNESRSTVGGEVVFSKTASTTGPRASTSTSHGGFDNDAPTMEAVLRRIINQPTGTLTADFPDAARGTRSFPTAIGLSVLPPELRDRLHDMDISVNPAPIVTVPLSSAKPAGSGAPGTAASESGGNCRALCIGINTYPAAPLAGCVADATAWARMLTTLGFDHTIMLTDDRATRSAILEALTGLLRTSRAGDTVVLQYAGHGTQVDDLDGDEDDSYDEAICPVDYATGAFIIDDDFATVFAQIPDGVNVTCFFDCCHSGTNTRLAVGTSASRPSAARPRFMVATPQMQEAHRQFRSPLGQRGIDPRRQPDLMRQVVFAACQDREVAYEQNQQGDFTRYCLPILERGGALTNEQLQAAVIAAFGPQARQHPLLDCAAAVRSARLFGLAKAGMTMPDGRGFSAIGAAAVDSAAGTARLLEAVATLLRERT